MDGAKQQGEAVAADVRRFTLDGEPVELGEFLRDNSFNEKELAEIAALKEGEVRRFGGGAGATFFLRCEPKKTNRWWFCCEAEYQEEGSHLIAAETEEEARELLRRSWGPGDFAETEIGVGPADDLDVIETWLRSDDAPPHQVFHLARHPHQPLCGVDEKGLSTIDLDSAPTILAGTSRSACARCVAILVGERRAA
jgi:hypothetical protein